MAQFAAIGPAGAFFIGGQALYRVNLATAVATHVANITFSHPMRTASSFAYDAVTGAYHVIETGDAGGRIAVVAESREELLRKL